MSTSIESIFIDNHQETTKDPKLPTARVRFVIRKVRGLSSAFKTSRL
jgi:hypothetical protein